MKFPVIKAPLIVNIIIVVLSIIISGFTLLFGISHLVGGIAQLFEGGNPDISNSEQLLGWFMVIVLCVIGVVFLVIAVAAIKGIDARSNKTD